MGPEISHISISHTSLMARFFPADQRPLGPKFCWCKVQTSPFRPVSSLFSLWSCVSSSFVQEARGSRIPKGRGDQVCGPQDLNLPEPVMWAIKAPFRTRRRRECCRRCIGCWRNKRVKCTEASHKKSELSVGGSVPLFARRPLRIWFR